MSKKFVLAMALAVCLTAHATAQQQSIAQPDEYVLRIKPAEAEMISEGLGFLTFNKVFPLMQKLRQQIVEQQAAIPVKPIESLNPAKKE